VTPSPAPSPREPAAPPPSLLPSIVRPTPPISRGAAALAIAARLAALHHPPDLLDPSAVAALIEHAGGSTRRLRAALASTLFLASSEDAPRIGAALVARALHDGPAPRGGARPAVTRPAWVRFWPLGLAGGAVLLALLAWPPRHSAVPSPTPPPTPAQMAPTPVPAHVAAARPAAVAAPAPALAAPQSQPAPLPPQPAPIVARPAPPAPLPTQFVAAPALPRILPLGPPSTVLLMLPGGDAATMRRAAGLAQRLRDAGIAAVETRPGHPAGALPPVSYFHAGDLGVARKASAVLTNEGWPNLSRDLLTPRLLPPPHGKASRRRGLVEIQLP
jgi:hypothetical protein